MAISPTTTAPPPSTQSETQGATPEGGGGSFASAIAQMRALGEERVQRDLQRTEVQEETGAAKAAASRTSA